MTVKKYNPLNSLSRLDDWFYGRGAESSEFFPAADIYETEKGVELRLELPGLAKKDVHLEVVDDYLTVKGEKGTEREDAKANRLETARGKFERRFYLGDKLDRDSVRAEAKDGVLTVYFDKRAEEKPKAIEIK